MASILSSALGDFGESLYYDILTNEFAMAALFFVVMLLGFFTIFRGLLRYFFKEGGQFKRKEVDVISFMLSLMGTGGLVFLFDGSARQFVGVFGGAAGLLIVVFFAVLTTRFFFMWSQSFEDGKVKWFVRWAGLALAFGSVLYYVSWVLDKVAGNSFFNIIQGIVQLGWEIALIALIVMAFMFLSSAKKGPTDSEGEGTSSLRKVLNEIDKETKKVDNYIGRLHKFLSVNSPHPERVSSGRSSKGKSRNRAGQTSSQSSSSVEGEYVPANEAQSSGNGAPRNSNNERVEYDKSGQNRLPNLGGNK